MSNTKKLNADSSDQKNALLLHTSLQENLQEIKKQSVIVMMSLSEC